MTKRVFIIHGWDEYPEEGWFPWLKQELERRGFQVEVPAMPDPAASKLDTWVAHLANVVDVPDENTFFVGHSMGCRTILRYLEALPKGSRVGGVVLVAGWITLAPAAMQTPEEQEIVQQWLAAPHEWNAMRIHTSNFTAIFSDDDEWVVKENWEAYRDHLGATIVVEHAKGHFSGSDGVTELPSALNAVLKHAQAI